MKMFRNALAALVLLCPAAAMAGTYPAPELSGLSFDNSADALAARQGMGLGTAATANTGTAAGNLLPLGTGGLYPDSAMPADVTSAVSQAAAAATFDAAIPSASAITTAVTQAAANTTALATLNGTGAGAALINASLGTTVAPLVGGKVSASYLPASTLTQMQAAELNFPEPTSSQSNIGPTSGLMTRLMIPLSDSTLIDYSSGVAGSTISPGSSTATVANGEVAFGAASGPITLPTYTSPVQTISWEMDSDVVAASLGSAAASGQYRNSPIGYASGNGVDVGMTQQWNATASADNYNNPQGFGLRWIQYQQANAGSNSTPYNTLLKTIDNAPHYFSLVINRSAGTITLYEDGIALQNGNFSEPSVGNLTNNANSIVWTLGGSPGTCGTPANCNFAGKIGILDVSSIAYSPTAVLQEYQAMKSWIEKSKGITASAEIEASVANVGAYVVGPSPTNGHDIAVPATGIETYFADGPSGYLSSAYLQSESWTGYIAPYSCTGSCSQVPAGTNAVLTVTAMTAGSIHQNEALSTTGGVAGGTIVTGFYQGSGAAGLTGAGATGQAGQYFVNVSQNVGGSGSPVAMSGTYGQSYNFIVDGGDSAGEPTVNELFNSGLNSIGQNWGEKFAIFDAPGSSNGLADRSTNLSGSYYTNVGTDPASQTQDAINQFMQIVKTHTANGVWIPLVETLHGNSSQSASAAKMGITNDIVRQYAPLLGYGVIDTTTDVRFGAFGSGALNTSKNCSSDGGSANDSYTYSQSDNLHPTICGQQLLAHMRTAMQAYSLNYPWNPEVLTAASVSLGYTDIGKPIILAGTTALTWPTCEGFMGGFLRIPVRNTGGSTATITPGFGYNGGAQDKIDGSVTPVTVAAGATVIFRNTQPADGVGGCGWTLTQ